MFIIIDALGNRVELSRSRQIAQAMADRVYGKGKYLVFKSPIDYNYNASLMGA